MKESINNLFDHFFHLDKTEIRLKFLFDHIRNYIISATVMAVGFYILHHAPEGSTSILSRELSSGIMIVLGLLTMSLNPMHPVWVMAKQDVGMIPYILISIFIFLTGINLFWSQVLVLLNA